MKYVYRNKNTKGVVELTKPRAEFEDSENWERIEGDAPQHEPDPDPIEVPTGSNPDEDGNAELSTQDVVNLVCDNLDEFESGQLEHLQSAIVDKLNAREGAPSIETAQVKTGDPGRDAVEAKGDSEPATASNSDEVDATDAAADLAKKEGIDLSKVKGSGDDGRILIGDVRDAVEAKGDSEPATASNSDEVDATDAAADLAKKEGIDLSKVKGSGDDGRILIGDVRDAVEAKGD